MSDVRNINKEDFFKQASGQDKIKFLLNFAILAPSVYNSQPWLFKISENKCTFYLDSQIQVKESDPEERNLYISLGCALENLIIAANFFGVFGKVLPIIENGKFIAAEVSFIFKDVMADSMDSPLINKEYGKLLDFMPRRQNVRGLFRNEAIPPDLLSQLSMFSLLEDFSGLRVDFLTNKDQVKSLGKIVSSGVKLSFRNKALRREAAHWMRTSFTSKKDGVPGYATGISVIFSAVAPYLISFINIGFLFARRDFNSFRSAPAVCVLGADEDMPASLKSQDKPAGISITPTPISKSKPEIWISTGRLTERILLEFAARGFDTSIFSVSGDLYKEVQKVVGMTERPEIMFCVGHITNNHQPTPRHEVDHKIKTEV